MYHSFFCLLCRKLLLSNDLWQVILIESDFNIGYNKDDDKKRNFKGW